MLHNDFIAQHEVIYHTRFDVTLTKVHLQPGVKNSVNHVIHNIADDIVQFRHNSGFRDCFHGSSHSNLQMVFKSSRLKEFLTLRCVLDLSSPVVAQRASITSSYSCHSLFHLTRAGWETSFTYGGTIDEADTGIIVVATLVEASPSPLADAVVISVIPADQVPRSA
ncbi:unnamed protein product [Phytophthora fragariaefolia]|uniref:Unnamed protein product n=1 Tax=Phytophthora fragariaefolia TaxID=1490495 RepID=A0A9W6XCF9_9STRA|nr:unnamed protein product [Phytophthora fragariaefolia]